MTQSLATRKQWRRSPREPQSGFVPPGQRALAAEQSWHTGGAAQIYSVCVSPAFALWEVHSPRALLHVSVGSAATCGQWLDVTCGDSPVSPLKAKASLVWAGPCPGRTAPQADSGPLRGVGSGQGLLA